MLLARLEISLALVLTLFQNSEPEKYKTIYQKIQQERAYSGFSELMRNNRAAKLNLHFDALTVFVPENKAFKNRDLPSNIAFYHMSFEVKPLDKLKTVHFLRAADPDFPPIWITKSGKDIYVNNARILQERSANFSLRGNASKQVLHVIDDILDPVIASPKFSPSAYDFLSSSENWGLGPSKTVSSFFHKVQENNQADVYKQKGGHTFFIPVDSGIDPHKFKMLNRHTIYGHIVPDYVLFSRPTEKNSPYDTLANDRFIYIIVSFEEKDDKLFVRGLAGGDLGNGNGAEGEFVAEVLVANIPVKNGVVHLVSQPLSVFNRTLKPFPFLPVLNKITSDPELEVFYKMGEETGFNKKLEERHVRFTYFVPKDRAWLRTRKHDLEPSETDLEILSRHLVVSEVPYSMDRLLALSRINNYTDIQLDTEGGTDTIDGEFYVKWRNRYIKVIKADYECTNGLVHVLAGPMTVFKRRAGNEHYTPAEIKVKVDRVTAGNDSSTVSAYWRSLSNVLRNIF
ncbi:hypothetical protein NQ318_015109 [Aromia moschata]|uniref:FAS1 domain-containing protein n=1 Tax=Aromia moschata TaxID=1265417 RepID=A0AAV8Z017_9CUCU|nr:hypothetical protein NQ318_015109 [Aromia moschata]